MGSIIWDLSKYKSKTALDTGKNRVTYGQLAEKSKNFSSTINHRTLVFLFSSNTIPSVVGYVGCINNGIVPVMIDGLNFDAKQVKHLIDVYHPEYLWLPNRSIDAFSEYDADIVLECEGYLLLRMTSFNVPVLHENLALLITTSGSTGSPRLVRQSYDNILANTKSIIEYLHISDIDRTITTLPMSYVYGLSIVNTHLYAGASIILSDFSVLQKEFWELLKEERVTSFGGVPYIYEMLDKLRFFNMELPFLRQVTQAGGKLPIELHKKFAKWADDNNKEFVAMYGASEATARMAYLPSERALEKPGSIGIAIPGGRFELQDDNTGIIEETEKPGELIYYGDNVTLGYAESVDDLSLGDEQNGVLRTGDIATVDEDGYYYIVGRKKRFLKIYGKRTSLDDVDAMLIDEFNTADIASAGTDDHLTVYTAQEIEDNEIISFLSLKLGINRAAFKVRHIDSIPRNPSGKILYHELGKNV